MCILNEKTALVTGASGGIGKAIVAELIAQGAKVALSGTRLEKLENTAKELGIDNPVLLPCNLADKDAVANLAKQAEESLGGLDIIVNNAGITKDGLAMRMSDEDWADVININLTSTFQIIRSALRGMMKRKTGRIINISSVVGVAGNPGQANYVASKAGMIGMSKALAQEVASRGITINCVAPGFIKTPMTDELTEDQQKSMIGNIPAGVFGEPSDIAKAVSYLASDGARYVTGQTIHVNGGMVMI